MTQEETTLVDVSARRPDAGGERGNLVRYSVLASLARLADEGARVGLVLLAVETTQSAGFGGLLVASIMLPHVVAAPLVGAVADATSRRKLFYSGALLVYAAALALTAVATGSLPRWVAVAAALAAGCVGPLLSGGLTSLLNELVPGRLRSAYGIDSTLYGLAGIVGPSAAALLAGAFGGRIAVYCLAGSAATASLLLWSLPLARRDRSERNRLRAANVLGAAKVIIDRPALGSVTLGSCLGQLGAGALPVTATLMAQRAHSTSLTGVILSLIALGALAGSLLYVYFPMRSWSPENAILVCLLATAVPFAAAAVFHDTPAVYLPAFAISGLVNGLMFCSLLVVRGREAPPELHTQVFTVGAGLKSASGAIGSAVAGGVAGGGVAALLAGVSLCHALGGLLGAAVLRAPRRRRLLDTTRCGSAR
ncbi:MFS transporter [Micromonospora sp. bgisy143]|uniref:MFS transporter n=1 Tax=Micromonospora sp. bgisy143 TaxID=3413790 RepID=UPI003EBF3812